MMKRTTMDFLAEFGEQWREYCKQVPAFIPRFKIGTRKGL
jgi:protein-S-isoprenylcysteine O-methyltransferase Ste14